MLINKLNFDKLNESKKLLEDLNKQLKEIETLQNDPEYYIAEYCRELARQVDFVFLLGSSKVLAENEAFEYLVMVCNVLRDLVSCIIIIITNIILRIH